MDTRYLNHQDRNCNCFSCQISALTAEVARLTAERDAAQTACGNFAQALADAGSRLVKLEAVAAAAREYVQTPSPANFCVLAEALDAKEAT